MRMKCLTRKPMRLRIFSIIIALFCAGAEGETVSFTTDEVRRLMNEESDSRKFYKLAELSTYFEPRSKKPFLPERARGLSLEGRAAEKLHGVVKVLCNLRENSTARIV